MIDGIKEFLEQTQKQRLTRPVLVAALNSKEKAFELGITPEDWSGLAGDDGRLTSFCGILKHAGDDQKPHTYLVAVNDKRAADGPLSDIGANCSANKRIGPDKDIAKGYMSISFKTGALTHILLTSQPADMMRLDEEAAKHSIVFFWIDISANMDSDYDRAFRETSIELTRRDSHECMHRPVGGYGTFCGAVGLLAGDIPNDHINLMWLKGHAETMPTFLKGSDIARLAKLPEETQKAEAMEIIKNTELFFSPPCIGSTQMGLREMLQQKVEPYPELAAIIIGSPKGMARFLRVLDNKHLNNQQERAGTPSPS